MSARVGFIGLGNMGRPMASNLARKGFPLVVYDIDRAAVDRLVEAGARAAASVGRRRRARATSSSRCCRTRRASNAWSSTMPACSSISRPAR